MKPSEIAYQKLEYLAAKYANKLYAYEEISLERDDLLQEFRLKIFTSIKAYGRRWLAYRRGQAERPIPLKYYVECACSHKCTDMMRAIQRENYKLRIDHVNYDFGVEDTTEISTEENRFVINGVDVLANLTGVRRAIFSMYIRGRSKQVMARMLQTRRAAAEGFDPNIRFSDAAMIVQNILEDQRQYLLANHKTALYHTAQRYEYYRLDDE